MEQRKVTIDRSRWARRNAAGEQLNGQAYLLNESGGRCCLGFYCEQIHMAKQEELINVCHPSDASFFELMRTPLPEDPADNLEARLVFANDREAAADKARTDAEQEAEISRLFRLVSIEVEFVN